MATRSELVSKRIQARASLNSISKRPSDCSTFHDLYDQWTDAGHGATLANDECRSRLGELAVAESELTAAQSAYGAAMAAGAAIGLTGAGAAAALAAVAAASLEVANMLAKRDQCKRHYDEAADKQNKALSVEKEAKDAVTSHRSSCPVCNKS